MKLNFYLCFRKSLFFLELILWNKICDILHNLFDRFLWSFSVVISLEDLQILFWPFKAII